MKDNELETLIKKISEKEDYIGIYNIVDSLIANSLEGLSIEIQNENFISFKSLLLESKHIEILKVAIHSRYESGISSYKPEVINELIKAVTKYNYDIDLKTFQNKYLELSSQQDNSDVANFVDYISDEDILAMDGYEDIEKHITLHEKEQLIRDIRKKHAQYQKEVSEEGVNIAYSESLRKADEIKFESILAEDDNKYQIPGQSDHVVHGIKYYGVLIESIGHKKDIDKNIKDLEIVRLLLEAFNMCLGIKDKKQLNDAKEFYQSYNNRYQLMTLECWKQKDKLPDNYHSTQLKLIPKIMEDLFYQTSVEDFQKMKEEVMKEHQDIAVQYIVDEEENLSLEEIRTKRLEHLKSKKIEPKDTNIASIYPELRSKEDTQANLDNNKNEIYSEFKISLKALINNVKRLDENAISAEMNKIIDEDARAWKELSMNKIIDKDAQASEELSKVELFGEAAAPSAEQ